MPVTARTVACRADAVEFGPLKVGALDQRTVGALAGDVDLLKRRLAVFGHDTHFAAVLDVDVSRHAQPHLGAPLARLGIVVEVAGRRHVEALLHQRGRLRRDVADDFVALL
jgi:hypothetical protein